MSKQIHSRVIVRKHEEAPKQDAPTKVFGVAKKRNALITLADQIARDKTVVYKNHPWPGGAKSFPNEFKLHTVSLYYPHAEGGPLFIDEPMFPHEVETCKRKAVVMKQLGHRYAYIDRDATLDDVVLQLGE